MQRIMLVDDDDVFRKVLARSLSRRGYQTCEAATPGEALIHLESGMPDACILDLKIGHESGLHLLPEMLRIKPDLKVVVLTGYASIATAVEAVKQGALNYLPKPADAEEILAAFAEKREVPAQAVLETPHMSVDRLEWEYIQKVLAENQGNISETARALGMHRRTLQRKLQKRPVKQ